MGGPHLSGFCSAEVRFKVPRGFRALECRLTIPRILNRRRLVTGKRVEEWLHISGHIFPACDVFVNRQATLLQRPCHAANARKCRLTRGFAMND